MPLLIVDGLKKNTFSDLSVIYVTNQKMKQTYYTGLAWMVDGLNL